MVSEEIHVEVHDMQEDTEPPSQLASRSGELTGTLSRGENGGEDDGASGEITQVGSDEDGGIEMKQLSPTVGGARNKAHAGVVTQARNVQALADSGAEAKTFVDELLAACVNGR